MSLSNYMHSHTLVVDHRAGDVLTPVSGTPRKPASHPTLSEHPDHNPLPGVSLLTPRLVPEAIVAVPHVPA
jgi:hypothetical protein